jgi:SAM-dependent methyltransferase
VVTTAPLASVHEPYLTPVERRALEPRRAALLREATGVVADLGGGTGAHLGLYRPDRVRQVKVVGSSGLTRSTLDRRARQAKVPVTFVTGFPDLPDSSVDTIVTQLVLCSVPDVRPVLAELDRVLAPAGRLLFIEHVPRRASTAPLRELARPAWRLVTAGCDLGADLPSALRAAGFTVTDIERIGLATFVPPLRSLALGQARRRLLS